MIAPVFFLIFVVLLQVWSWEDTHNSEEWGSPSQSARPRRSRKVDLPETGSISVDASAHAARLHDDSAVHFEKSGEAEASIAVDHSAHAAALHADDAEHARHADHALHGDDSVHDNRSEEEELREHEEILASMGLKPGDETHGTSPSGLMRRQGMNTDSQHLREWTAWGAPRGSLSEHDHDFELPDEHEPLPQSLEEESGHRSARADNTWWWSSPPRRRAPKVNCVWNAWVSNKCPVTCDGGVTWKTRTKYGPYFGGSACAPAPSSLASHCGTALCPRNCKWTAWVPWTACSATCGDAQKIRTRMKDGPFHGGVPCAGHATETQACNAFSCPADCFHQPWSAWGACSKTCIDVGEYGVKTRDRAEVVPFFGGVGCTGETTDDEQCNQFTCPYDCSVGVWSPWSICTQTCSKSVVTHGYKIRSRSSLAASNGGKMCAENWQMNHCNTQLCSFDCYLLDWGAWGPCSKTCTESLQPAGINIRVRDKVGPAMGGSNAECEGAPMTQTRTCNDFNCPVDCVWNPWGSFGPCSKTCGMGAHKRNRDNVPARYGGHECIGPTEHVDICNAFSCAINCEWAAWNAWKECTRSCGHGTAHRSRSYDPKPENGGTHCEGAHMEMINCNGHECPINCQFEEWLDWSLCTVTCGAGTRTRVRLVAISASFGGMECNDPNEPASHETPCPNENPCPMDCRWDEWGEWSSGCKETCGENVSKTSVRTLLTAENGGIEDCPDGDPQRHVMCPDLKPCPSEPFKMGARPSSSQAICLALLACIFLAVF